MIEEKKYNGFFCIKCNYIPLIQIIPKKENVNILYSCKCCKNYIQLDMFIKKYYKSNIPINKISKEPTIISNQEIKKRRYYFNNK